MEKEYIFKSYVSTDITHDPVFKNEKFDLFGNSSEIDDPELYWSEGYRYLLIKPSEVNNDAHMLFKIACYLFYHPNKFNDKHIVYFIGDKNIGENIEKQFSNQIVKLISYKEINNWFPKNIDEILKYALKYLLGLQKYYGQVFSYQILHLPYLFFIDRNLTDEEKNESFLFFKNILFEENYLKYTYKHDYFFHFTLTRKTNDEYSNEIKKAI